MLGEYTNNKMAAPAPVQLQRPVTVSDLVCCVFVYGPMLNADETFNQINFNGNFTLNTTLMWSPGLESCILLKNINFSVR